MDRRPRLAENGLVVLLQRAKGGKGKGETETEFEGDVIFQSRSDVDTFDVLLDFSNRYHIIAFGREPLP